MIISHQDALQAWLADRTIGHRNRVVCAYHFLARRAARKFAGRPEPARDLEQVASIGLMKAVERYEPRYGAPFEAYAWAFMCGEVMHHLRDCEQLLRVPRSLRYSERKRELPILRVCRPADLEGAGDASGGTQSGPALEDRILLQMALDELPARERYVVFKLVSGHTQSEVGAALGFSQRHISRLYARAVQRMARHWA